MSPTATFPIAADLPPQQVVNQQVSVQSLSFFPRLFPWVTNCKQWEKDPKLALF